ncbi:MAG TPA: prenyltransferase/squalene oxidase repeat-containing protein [Planctomycetota bacterium]|nr:prenyltransferase/squalene oxidase repeat-containing protein [Planctomycetota bacterium]
MLAVLAALLIQAPPGGGVDSARVEEAIRRGIDFLRTARAPGVGFAGIKDSYELVLLTFVHAGVPETDPRFRELFRKMMEEPPANTYKVVLQAMILEEVHRVKYQPKIAQCAQFLEDNQCRNGQWGYGEPSEFVKEVPPPRDVATSPGDRSGVREFDRPGDSKPRVVRRIAVRKMKEGPAQGDNSNSQYAALGLRACHDAGIVLPKEVLQKARAWWVESQHADESRAAGAAVASGLGGPARGWCYSRLDVCAKAHRPYFGMTAGGVASLAIYDHLLEIDLRRDPAVRAGIQWLAASWSVTENRGTPEFDPQPKSELYYALYALERVGMLCGLEKIGPHDWYAEGARAILDAQRKDGSWSSGVDRCDPTWDTCFAILFLKKATRALVASEDGRARRGGEEK